MCGYREQGLERRVLGAWGVRGLECGGLGCKRSWLGAPKVHG